MSAMAKKQKEKGDAFMADAEQKMTKSKSSWFSSSKERKFEEAAELMEQAANAYKVGGLNQEAGEAYRKAAEIHRDQLTNLNEASKDMSNAGELLLYSLLLTAVFQFVLTSFLHPLSTLSPRKMFYQEQPRRCGEGFQ